MTQPTETNATCPKCGAEQTGFDCHRRQFRCGFTEEFPQPPGCRIAELTRENERLKNLWDNSLSKEMDLEFMKLQQQLADREKQIERLQELLKKSPDTGTKLFPASWTDAEIDAALARRQEQP